MLEALQNIENAMMVRIWLANSRENSSTLSGVAVEAGGRTRQAEKEIDKTN